MKLLFCSNCTDVIRLTETTRYCQCGECGGRYTDDINAIYSGATAVPIGFSNHPFVDAVQGRPLNGMGKHFEAFVIPIICQTYKLVPKKELENNP